MIIVTGGAGFIGSNLVKGLNDIGIDDVLVVDDLEDGHKYTNISDLRIYDYEDKARFFRLIESNSKLPISIDCVFHLGACSSTTEWNGNYMMDNNYRYSKHVYHYCQRYEIPFIYASSAAVYGKTHIFKESEEFENPLNIYGYSKLLFDNYVRKQTSRSQVVGLRYFNVYGPRESHKKCMASVAFHHMEQLKNGNTIKLFGSYDGYDEGEQKRDFVYVEDVTKVMLWFLRNPDKAGIFNVGTGRAQTFNDVGRAVIACHCSGDIRYVAFPDSLKDTYQSFTQADLSALRDVGYEGDFCSVEQGVSKYWHALNGSDIPLNNISFLQKEFIATSS